MQNTIMETRKISVTVRIPFKYFNFVVTALSKPIYNRWRKKFKIPVIQLTKFLHTFQIDSIHIRIIFLETIPCNSRLWRYSEIHKVKYLLAVFLFLFSQSFKCPNYLSYPVIFITTWTAVLNHTEASSEYSFHKL